MPSFNLIPKTRDERIAAWNVGTTPSSVGWLTEFFRTRPGTVRSNHYCHSVAVAGRHAQEFLANPDPDAGPDSPWDAPGFGKDFGTHSPMPKAYRNPNGQILMLGTDYHSSTYMHYVEVLYWEKRKATDPDAPYRWLQRETLGEYWDAVGPIRRDRVGDADSRLFSIADFVDTLLAEVEAHPSKYCK
jgi:aminoglycoside 3-N-acetyltransferase